MLKAQLYKGRLNMILLFITIIHVYNACIGCESKILYVNEGETTKLNFSYPCNSTRITLQHGYRSPSYSSANPEYLSLPTNQNLTNQKASEECSLHLTINPVSRDNAGTYILTAYKDGRMLPDYPRIGLRVSYPPGKASCQSSSDYLAGLWIKLHCTAPKGNVAGKIACYQTGFRLPPFTMPLENGGTLNQDILARLANYSVRCCSSASDQVKTEHQCDDCGWDPIHDIPIQTITGPSPTVSPTQGSQSAKHPTADGIALLTSPQTKIEILSKDDANSRIGLYIALSFMSLTTVIFAAMYFLKVKGMKPAKKKGKGNGSNESDTQEETRLQIGSV